MSLILYALGHHLFQLNFKHLPLFLNIYLHFFSQNSLVGCPRLDARAVAPSRNPFCTPLFWVNLKICNNRTLAAAQ